jgi:DNA-binding transcriptional MocR family regulator
MPLERRLQIIEIARRHGVAIIEDDVYGLLPDEAPTPLAALAPDVAWYVTGFGKCVAAGLRIGYALAPDATAASAVVERFRVMSTWFPAPLQAALALRWVEDGTAARITAAVRPDAARRRALGLDVLCGVSNASRDNALHVWLHLAEPWTPRDFVDMARRHGVLIRSGEFFAAEDRFRPRAVRVCTGGAAAEDLAAGLQIIRDLADRSPPLGVGVTEDWSRRSGERAA